VQEPEVQVLRGNAGNPLLVALLGFRDTCHARLLRALPEPQASVAAGMLLGLKAAVPDPTYDAFARTGLVHLLVVSGWHLSLVAGLLTGLAAHLRLGRGASFWVALAGIWLYALFVGATPTVLRAALMASLIVLAGSTSRKAEPWTLLLAACLALTLWEPQMLWDVGFQLSALATASLFAFSAPLHRWLEHLPALRWSGARAVTSTLAATLAVQVLVLPLILYHFGNLSLVAPLANVLLVPLVPFAMLLGALALVVSLAVAPLAGGLWLVAWLPFAALTGGAAWLAELPGASLRLPAFPLWVLFGYYALVFIGWMGQKWVRRWHTAVVWT
jgi:competence protein ComEC